MADTILANLVSELRLRSDGITKHLTTLSTVGLTQADIDAGKAYAAQLEQLNSEQESLKSTLKTKTTELSTTKREAPICSKSPSLGPHVFCFALLFVHCYHMVRFLRLVTI